MHWLMEESDRDTVKARLTETGVRTLVRDPVGLAKSVWRMLYLAQSMEWSIYYGE